MKRLATFFLTTMCCVMALLSTLPAKAQVVVDGIKYYIGDDDATVVPYNDLTEDNYNYLQGDVVIKDKVMGKTVTCIGDCAFIYMKSAVNITLPSTIKEIRFYAFHKATGLKSILLNEGLETMGPKVFYGCTSLESVYIPSTLTVIPDYAFAVCSSLPSIVIPSSITDIDDYAFVSCASLQTVQGRMLGNITDNIFAKHIGKGAFADCTNLQHIAFSIYLESIGERAFENCSKLKDIKLPVSLTSIGEYAFKDSGLKTVTNYSTTPQVIKTNVFDGVNLSECTLYVPKDCKEKYKNADVWKNFGQILEPGETPIAPITTGKQKIGYLYYDLHEDLTATLVKDDSYKNYQLTITVPSSVTFGKYTYTVKDMEESVFEDCRHLTNVVLPNTMTELPKRAFYYCFQLKSVTLPASLEKIGGYAFVSSGIESISIPPTVSSLGNSAFKNCMQLTNVSLPAGITIIPNSCFSGCAQLTNVKIPSTVTTIVEYAFSTCCRLSSITIPSNVALIGEFAFKDCSGLQSIKCERRTPADLSGTSNVFFELTKYICTLYVPSGCKEAYSNAAVWKDFVNISEKGETERIQVDGLYYQLKEDFTAEVTYESEVDNYTNLSGEVTVKDKVVYQDVEYKVNAVGPYAFANSQKITKVNLPKIMDIIYGSAFKNCTNLADINIPATLTHLDHYAFNGTKLFNDNKDEDGAVYYDHCLIYYPLNSKEGNYEVKPGTRLLASYVFSGDVKLKGLILPEGLQCICKYALDGMQRLETLSLPSSVYFVADGFCNNAKKLSTIYNYMKTPLDVSEVKNCFENVSQNLCTLYVPAGTRTTYQKAEKWKDFNIVEMDPVIPNDEKVYTVFDESTGTLTYRYDDKFDNSNAYHELYDPVNEPNAIRFTGYHDQVKKAVIDLSMKSAQLTSMRNMFYGGYMGKNYNLSAMTTIEGLENLNTAIVTNMMNMFAACSALTSLDLNLFDTQNVTDMSSMFDNCSSLQTLNVNSFDIDNVTNMAGMFSCCSELTTIYCSNNWSNSEATSSYMFNACNKLVGGEGTTWNDAVMDKSYACPDGGPSAPGYFTIPATLKGDADGDGEVTAADIVAMTNYIMGNTPADFSKANADVNLDGVINIADIVAVTNILLE